MSEILKETIEKENNIKGVEIDKSSNDETIIIEKTETFDEQVKDLIEHEIEVNEAEEGVEDAYHDQNESFRPLKEMNSDEKGNEYYDILNRLSLNINKGEIKNHNLISILNKAKSTPNRDGGILIEYVPTARDLESSKLSQRTASLSLENNKPLFEKLASLNDIIRLKSLQVSVNDDMDFLKSELNKSVESRKKAGLFLRLFRDDYERVTEENCKESIKEKQYIIEQYNHEIDEILANSLDGDTEAVKNFYNEDNMKLMERATDLYHNIDGKFFNISK